MKDCFKKFSKTELGKMDVICPGLGHNPVLNGPGSNLKFTCIIISEVVWRVAMKFSEYLAERVPLH
jgi:hypothetical protein